MKKSLSLLAAASATVALMPLAFAESSASSSSSAATVSSSSSSSSMMSSAMSSASSMAPCMDKTGVDRVLCMNDISRKKNKDEFVSRDTRNTKKTEIKEACGDKRGIQKAICVRRTGKAMMKAAERKVGKIWGQAVEQSEALAKCTGLRGTRLALCFRNLKVRNTPTMGTSSSSAASSASSVSGN